MRYETVFDRYTFDKDKAIAYGFTFADDRYTLRKPLREDGFYAVVTVENGILELNVFEEPDGIQYLPFNVRGMEGGFVGAIREQADEIVADIQRKCCVMTDVKAILLEYLHDKYGTVPNAPWGALEEYHTVNTDKKGKWYGLFMLIPYRYLGLDVDGKIHVLNLKVKPEDIPKIIDNRHFFPSYHMNKKYWISILLDKDVDIDRVKELLDDSYDIVEGRK